MSPQQRTERSCRKQADGAASGRAGFTLIELLVSMAILVVIVLIVARIFQQASMAWQTGTQTTEKIMTGRAVADFVAQQLSHAIPDTNGATFDVSSSLSFMMIEEASAGTGAVKMVSYDKARLADGIVDLKAVTDPEGAASPWTLPRSAVVTVTMSNNVVFQSSAFFSHRDRDRL